MAFWGHAHGGQYVISKVCNIITKNKQTNKQKLPKQFLSTESYRSHWKLLSSSLFTALVHCLMWFAVCRVVQVLQVFFLDFRLVYHCGLMEFVVRGSDSVKWSWQREMPSYLSFLETFLSPVPLCGVSESAPAPESCNKPITPVGKPDDVSNDPAQRSLRETGHGYILAKDQTGSWLALFYQRDLMLNFLM